jgi:hypothetical protein
MIIILKLHVQGISLNTDVNLNKQRFNFEKSLAKL